MTRRLALILGGGVVLFVAAMAAAVGLLLWREQSLPVYAWHQEISPDGRAVTDTLALNGVLYVHSFPEFPLDAVGHRRRVGKAEGGMRVYAAGRGSYDDYLVLNGFMFPDIVYRRADVPVFDPQRLPISDLQLTVYTTLGPKLRMNQDPELIAEVLARLREPGPLTATAGAYKTYSLGLRSPQAPGVAYCLYLTLTPDGEVQLAERATPDEWFAAGEGLAQWARELTGRSGG